MGAVWEEFGKALGMDGRTGRIRRVPENCTVGFWKVCAFRVECDASSSLGGGMVDTLVLEASVERRGGSSPPSGTKVGNEKPSIRRLFCYLHQSFSAADLASTLRFWLSSSVTAMFAIVPSLHRTSGPISLSSMYNFGPFHA